MKTTSIKGVLSFCVAVTVTVAMAYSAVTVIQKNNAATEKAVKESQAIGSEVSTDSLKDGEYEGTATGYGGPLTVRITIKGGKLTDIKVVSHTETPEYFSRASAVIGKILNSGNVNVDSVSGATISSNAIKKAVADALRKAGSKQKAIPLFITSFKSVRRKMNGKTWKNIQRMAYPFFIGIYVHIMVLYSADVKSHMTGIIVYTVIYACYVILRLRKAALKSRKAKIATA